MTIESWTDLDYAQAAIDMLPGSVEEIVEFLPRQGIKNQWDMSRCPLSQWIEKWVVGRVGTGRTSVNLYPPHAFFSDWVSIDLPPAAREYIRWVDSL